MTTTLQWILLTLDRFVLGTNSTAARCSSGQVPFPGQLNRNAISVNLELTWEMSIYVISNLRHAEYRAFSPFPSHEAKNYETSGTRY